MDILGSPEAQMLRRSAISAQRKYPDRIEQFVKDAKENNDDLIEDFSVRRKANEVKNRRMGSAGVGGDVYAAIPRFYHPEEWFKQTQIPYDLKDDKHRFELYRWLDFFYKTHWLIPMLVDIFTRFPLVGIELVSPDKQLKAFYEDLFFDKLDYEQFLVDLGREYWTFGQSFPLGHFNETLGVWEEEELLDLSAVKVRQVPIIGGKQFYVVPDKQLIDIAKKRNPPDLYHNLETYFPHILPYLVQEKDIPISDVLLKQVAFKASPRDLYGTPLLLRSLRTLMHEEKLMAMQDAIAERGYSPLLLFKLGTNDMGPNRPPFIPGPAEIQALRNDLDIAFSSDFRVLVHHFALEAQSVFGRETMPKLGDDFDRIERRIMQTFGINPNLLAGGAASAPYASSALQAEFLSQILRTFQHFLIKHYKARANIVAEAQEHFAYEKRGDTRVPITEEVLERDPNTGEQRIVEKKKLMIPEMRMKVLDLRDEATQRNFLQALKQQGVPIPDQDVAMGMHYVFDDALNTMQEEMIQKTVAQQEAKVKTYRILKAKNLPIPPELQQEIESAGIAAPAAGESTDVGVQAPTQGEQIVMPGDPDATPGIGPEGPGMPGRSDQPQVSQERMPGIGLKGPTLPGVPGQPGVGGIPGAPVPAVGAPPQGSPGAPGAGVRSKVEAASEPGGDRDIFDARVCPHCGGSVTPNNDTVGVNAECGKCGRVYDAEEYDTLPARQSIVYRLPRNKADHQPEKLHNAEFSATITEDEQEEVQPEETS